jgi:hypothetical protein
LITEAHQEFARTRLSLIAKERRRLADQSAKVVASDVSVSIPLSTVSLNANFDATISISFRGAAADCSVTLCVDSGNSSLIVPDFSAIQALPQFAQNYKVLKYGSQEPWGCPANVVCGPIEVLLHRGVFEIPKCVFYACTGPDANGNRTTNFGTGCIVPWSLGNYDAVQAPLSYSDYAFAEFRYAPATEIFAATNEPNIVDSSLSSLTLHKTLPPGYPVMLNIIKQKRWMCLRPRSLSIGGVPAKWPAELASSSIAMVDTGGGPVFLSDPKDVVWTTNWKDPAPLPWWVGGYYLPLVETGSYSCQSINSDLSIELADENNNSISYHIDTTKMPLFVQGLTLVACKKCYYMFEENGLNIGGLSALFNNILIDYGSARVGFKAKPLELV